MTTENIEEVIKLSQNENPLGPSPIALEAIQKASKEIHRYPEPHSRELTEALAAHLELEPENLFVSAGSTEALDIIIRNAVNKGEHMITGSLTFAAYRLLAQVYGINSRFCDLKDYRFDVEAILKLYNEKTRVITIANPNNPTGTIVTHDEVAHLLRSISRETYLVIDEAYMEYVEDENYPRTMELRKEFPNLIILRTFSKIYGLAGMRVGYAIISPEVNDKLGHFQAPFTVSKLASLGAIAALKDQNFIELSQQLNREGRAYLTTALRALGINVPTSQANFVYLSFDNQVQRDAIGGLMQEQNIIARNTDMFGDPNGIRITVGSKTQNERVIESLTAAQKA